MIRLIGGILFSLFSLVCTSREALAGPHPLSHSLAAVWQASRQEAAKAHPMTRPNLSIQYYGGQDMLVKAPAPLHPVIIG
jgi:hypothetical protein